MSLPCAACNFGLLSGSLLCFIWNPIRKKNVKPNKRAVSTKSKWIANILNPPAETFFKRTSSFYSGLVKRRME